MFTALIRFLGSIMDFFEKPADRVSERWLKDHLYTSGKGS